METEAEQEAAANILHSIFSNDDVYINNQQIYNSNRLYVQSYISSKLKETFSDYKGVLHSKVYEYEEFLDEILEAALSETFSTRWMELLSRLDRFMMYGNFFTNQ